MESIITHLQNRRSSDTALTFAKSKLLRSDNDNGSVKQCKNTPKNQRNHRLNSLILYGNKSTIHSEMHKSKVVPICHTHCEQTIYPLSHRSTVRSKKSIEIHELNFFTRNEVKNSRKAYAQESKHFIVDKLRAIKFKQPIIDFDKILPKIVYRNTITPQQKNTFNIKVYAEKKFDEGEISPWSQAT